MGQAATQNTRERLARQRDAQRQAASKEVTQRQLRSYRKKK